MSQVWWAQVHGYRSSDRAGNNLNSEALGDQMSLWTPAWAGSYVLSSPCSLAAIIVVCSSMGIFSFSSNVVVDVVVVNFRFAQHCDCVLCFFHLNKFFFFYQTCILLCNFQSSWTQFYRMEWFHDRIWTRSGLSEGGGFTKASMQVPRSKRKFDPSSLLHDRGANWLA
jgi:hypothetical protein